ncbi:MAG: Ig-like domain-containing protein [Chitinophagaceae bacterium]
MKRICYLLFLPVLITGVLLSCSRGGDPVDPNGGGGVHTPTPEDTTAPVLDIYTPAATQVFANGTTISVTGKATDDYGLYRGSVRIYNDGNGLLLKEQLYEIHGIKSYNFTVNHLVSTTLATDYTVTVSFEDHGYNVTTKSVKVKANP